MIGSIICIVCFAGAICFEIFVETSRSRICGIISCMLIISICIIVSLSKFGVTYTEERYELKNYDFIPCYVTDDGVVHKITNIKSTTMIDKDTKEKYLIIKKPNNTYFMYGEDEYYLMVPEK